MIGEFGGRLDAIHSRADVVTFGQLSRITSSVLSQEKLFAVGIAVGADGVDAARVTVCERVTHEGNVALNTVNPNGHVTIVEWIDRPSVEIFADFDDAVVGHEDHRFEFADWSRGPWSLDRQAAS